MTVNGPVRGTCSVHPEETDVLLYGWDREPDKCANAYRDEAYRAEHVQKCDRCPNLYAFRDPLGRKDEFLCMSCHREDGYVPGERAMITTVAARMGVTHSQGRQDPCIAAGGPTTCKGQVKPRGKLGVLCDWHHNPKKWLGL